MSTLPPAPPTEGGQLDKSALARTLSHRPSLPRHLSSLSTQVESILRQREEESQAAAAGAAAPALLSLIEAVVLLVLGAAVALYAPSSLFWRLAALWIFIELAAYVAFKSRYAEANQRLDYRFDAKAVAQVKARFLSLARVVCIKEFMSGWFHGAHPDTIGRGNVEDFVAYGFYTRTKADLPREQRDAIEAFVREVERRWGVTFAAGRNPALRFMAHLWEPLRVIHKPLALHAACEAATLTSHAALWCAGFRKHHVAGFDYWYREPVAVEEEKKASSSSSSTTAATAATAAANNAAPAPSPFASAPPPAAASDSDVDADVSRSPTDESGDAAATATAARASSASEGEVAAGAAAAARASARASSHQRAASLNNANGLWRRGDSFSSLAGTGRSPLRSRRNTAGTAEASTSGNNEASAAEEAQEASASASASAAVRASSSSDPSTSASASESNDADTATPTKKRPVFFVHGVGFGLVPYLGLIALVARAAGRDRPLVLLEVPHVSLRFRSRRAQPVDDVAAAAVAVLARHGHDDAAFVAHSYGTFCVSRICQLHRRAVAAALLVDPVCCLTCYPHLLFNFVYKIPSMAAALAGGAAGALNVARFLFSRDLTIAETFCRRFLWHELMLWPEDMPPATVIALSHDDDLVPSPLVAAHLATAAPGVQVLYHPTASHGGVLLDFAFQRKMVNALAAVVDSPATSASAATAPVPPKAEFVVGGGKMQNSSSSSSHSHHHAEAAAAQARALLAAKAERVAAAEAARGSSGKFFDAAPAAPVFFTPPSAPQAPRATPTTDAAIAAAVAAAGSSSAAAASAARRRARRDAVRSWG